MQLEKVHTTEQVVGGVISAHSQLSKSKNCTKLVNLTSMAAARYKMISIPDAQATVLQHTPVLESEQVPLGSALGRVLAQTVTARDNLPPFPASIMVGLSATA